MDRITSRTQVGSVDYAARTAHRASEQNERKLAELLRLSACDSKDLKKRSVRSGALTLTSQGISLFVQTVSTVVLARLLTPEDYGVVAMVLAVTAFAGIFKNMGLSSATIQTDQLTHEQVSTMFWLNLAVGILLTAAVAALAPFLVWFYGQQELFAVTLALSVTFLISSLGIQHSALLTRGMRFKALAVSNITSSVLATLTSILTALAGLGYWALVIGTIVGTFSQTAMPWTLCRWIPGAPRKGSGVRGYLRFGANLTAFDLVNYFSRNLDNVLIGRIWGAEALGFYTRAYSLLMFPIANLRGPLNSVAFPALSQLQRDPVRYRAYFHRLASVMAFASMPLAGFLFVSSDRLISLALGPQWSATSDIFGVLAITAFIQPVAGLRGVVLMSSGMGGRYFRWGLWNAIVTVIGFGVGVTWGPIGIAVSLGVITYLILYPSLSYCFRDTPIKVLDFFGAIVRPAVSTVAAVMAAYLCKNQLEFNGDIAMLLSALIAFLPVYFLTFALLPGSVRELNEYLSYRAFFGWGDTQELEPVLGK